MGTAGLGEKTLAKVLATARADATSPADIVQLRPEELVRRYRLRRDVADGVNYSRDAAERLGDRLDQHGVSLLVRHRPGYPKRIENALGDDAPPVLFFHGSAKSLDERSVGVSGSRHASEQSLALARSLAGDLANADVNVVSGNANGVDLAAHHGALAASGATTFVLADGILSFRPRGAVADVFDDGRALVLSEFPPDLGWIARNAMRRNRTICALSQGMVIVEASDSGGTFAAGQEALKLGCPLFVADHLDLPESAIGNRKLIRGGAQPLRLNEDFKLDVRQLLACVTDSDGREVRKPQLPLLP